MEQRSKDEIDILNNIEIFKNTKSNKNLKKVGDDLSSQSTSKSLKAKKDD